jgi:hypothetical protein
MWATLGKQKGSVKCLKTANTQFHTIFNGSASIPVRSPICIGVLEASLSPHLDGAVGLVWIIAAALIGNEPWLNDSGLRSTGTHACAQIPLPRINLHPDPAVNSPETRR